MPQLFPPSANKLTRYGTAVAILGFGALLWGLALYNKSDAVTGVGYTPKQPVPFNHVQHVNQVGMDCRYCHTGVEKASFANIPPTETCMTCHSQVKIDSPKLELVRNSYQDGTRLKWERVNQVADYVYFNHSIHTNKGIGCTSCHGRVDQMPEIQKAKSFQMSMCLECHRNPERYVRPKEQVFNPAWQPPANQLEVGAQLVKDYHIKKGQLENCAVCHR
ncbi:MAG: cytochrome c3 family protein [Candidatus Sericytochromatia bacterium]|nr:cytochrome c3 family protein [Candidatus Sericytochromatia bacterium]